MWKKLKSLHLEKRKSMWIMAAVEILLLAVAAAGLFGKDGVYHFDGKDMTLLHGEQDSENGEIYIDETYQYNGEFAEIAPIELPAGVYQVVLQYKSDVDWVNSCEIKDESARYKNLLSNGEHMFTNRSCTDFHMWLKHRTDSIKVILTYGGMGELTVMSMDIYETNDMAKIWIFLVIAMSLSVNAVYCLVQYDRQYPIAQKTKNIMLGLAAVTIMASYPLMVDSIMQGGDTSFHLERIEGIKDGLETGQFPVRIGPGWLYGYGYAAHIFYGDTMIALQALFRMIGFTILTSYRMYQFLMTLATVLLSYFCFQKIFKEPYIGLLCSLLYSFSVYRLFQVYPRGGYGEECAMLFLPLLAYGFFKVFSEDIHTKEYKKNWLPLTIGFSGLLQSHLLTGELAGLFTILLCIIMWKKVFRKETFLVLAKTVGYSCVISAWFLVPFVDYMTTGDFVIHHVSARTIQDRGLSIAHLFKSFWENGNNSLFEYTALQDSISPVAGISLMFCLAAWCYIRISKGRDLIDIKEWNLGRIAAVFSMLAIVMSLGIFPWTSIQFLNSITETLVSSLQFSHRFMIIATLTLTLLGGVCSRWFMAKDCETGRKTRGYFGLYCLILGGLLMVSSVNLSNSYLDEWEADRLYNSEIMSLGYLSGREYLPYDTDITSFTYEAARGEADGIIVEDYEKYGLTTQTTCRNEDDVTIGLRIPMIYYKGYRAYDMETGEKMEVYDGENHILTVEVPSGYEGTILTEFVSPWYWRMAEIVSGAGVLAMTISLVRFYRRRR